MPDALIELKCWKHWREPEYGGGVAVPDPWDCFWRAVYSLVPKEEFVRHRWSEEHVYDWTTEDFVIIWGAASSSKSNDIGLLALLDWMTDPHQTVTIMASTSLAMLKIRSYESVLRYFHTVKRHAPYAMPGKLRKTDSAIILDSDDEMGADTDKASIRGVAVAEGTEQEARAKLQGAHLPYVRLILDELSQMRPAAMSVRTNLSIGAKSFKLMGMCNPDSFTDLAARHSVPLQPGGFAALDPDTSMEWRSQYGKIRRHDGLRSQAITDPDGDRRFPFLLTRSRLEQILKEHSDNPDDPEVWTMVRGFPPSQGRRQTLISMTEIMRYGATRPVQWYGAPSVTVLGVDPAFTEGGNRGVLQALDIGLDQDLKLKLSFHEPRFVKLEASSAVPILVQIGIAVAGYAEELGVPGQFIGVDDSATQSVADHLTAHPHNLAVQRFVSNKKASELPVSSLDRQPAKEKYANQITELWAAAAAFIRSGQARNFPLAAADQLAGRAMEEGKRPMKLQSKKATRREGNDSVYDSPDDMDAVAYAVGVARFFLRMVAGSDSLPAKYGSPARAGMPNSSGLRRLARKYDLDARAYAGETAETH
jgi:hypothetical protein